MQLKIQTDYAIRILLYLAASKRRVTGKELSSVLGVAETYLPKIIAQLRKAKWVSSAAGITGGYELVKGPGQITLLDIMQLMEDTMRLNRCLEDDEYCSRNAVDNCPVHTFYVDIQKNIEASFASVSIEDCLRR